MVLTKYINKNCVVSELVSKNKADVIKELTHLLFDRKRMQEVNTAIDQIIAREVTESTGIGQGIAVPHARITGMKTLACAVGRVHDGLDFMAIDRKPVHLVFLICYPPNEQTTYLNFVATVARVMSQEGMLQQALDAPDEEAVFNVLEQASANFADRHEEQIRQVKADPAIAQMPDAHADLILLARLQLCQEMLAAAKSGKGDIKKKMDNIRALVEPRILRHYDRLIKGRPPAVVAVEGDTCQGCFMRLPSKFVQQVRQDAEHVHTCTNCSRYIYVV